MLQAHLNAIETVLLAQSQAANNAGHPMLRGGPREWFLRDFLSNHIPSNLEVGQGEIIDANSRPGPPPGAYRPQVDVILYRRDVPKIWYSTYNAAFLVEGVMATIEVKSTLTIPEFTNACRQSVALKALQRPVPGVRMGAGWVPPHIVSYVASFDGPVGMNTVAGWFPQLAQALGATPDQLPEMVVVLGRGVVWRINAFPVLQGMMPQPGHNWGFLAQNNKNLLLLFVHMLTWMGIASSPPNILSYAQHVTIQGVGTI